MALSFLGGKRTTGGGGGGGGGGGAGVSPPPPIPGYYGPRWGNRKPTNLPASAPGASAPGAGRDYALAYARRYSQDRLWLAAVDHMGDKESKNTLGRPADAFDSPNKQAWGIYQYFSSSAADEVTFGRWRGTKVWDMPWELQVTAPIDRFWIRFNEAIEASPRRDPVAGVVGIFLHQAKPAWRHRFWELLRAGVSPLVAVRQTCDEKGDSAAGAAIERHVNLVLAAAGAV